MSQFTLRLPESLHQQLIDLAEREGVSLNQYIVYALTRQVTPVYTVQVKSVEEIQQQKQAFQALIEKLGESSAAEITAALDEREIVQPEEELTPEIITRFQQRIRDASRS